MAALSYDIRGEIWKAFVHDEIDWLEVSTLGRVRSMPHIMSVVGTRRRQPHLRRCPSRLLKCSRFKGYDILRVRARSGVSRNLKVHQMVCATFNGPRPFEKAVVAHLNGIRNDNRPDNLIWTTFAENSFHARLHDTWARGERSGRARLSEAEVIEIRQAYRKSVPLKVTAERFGVSIMTASDIGRGRSWKHIPESALHA